jgi:hypothetical protein
MSMGAGQKYIPGGNFQRGADLAPHSVRPGNAQPDEVAADDKEARLPVIEIDGPDFEVVQDSLRFPVKIEPEAGQVGPEGRSDAYFPVPGPKSTHFFSPSTRSRLRSQKSAYPSQKTKLHPQWGAGSDV